MRQPPDFRILAARVGCLLWLAFAWTLLWGTISVGTIASGLGVGLAVMWLLPLPRVPVEGRLHLLSALWLALTILGYLVSSSLQVFWIAIRPSAPPTPAVLRVPMQLKSDFCLALAVNALNLIPGGIVVRIDPRRRLVYVHVLDAGTQRAVETFRHQVATLERRFIRAFERPEDWKPSPWHDEAYRADDELGDILSDHASGRDFTSSGATGAAEEGNRP